MQRPKGIFRTFKSCKPLKNLILIFLSLLGLSLKAQQTYFNGRYNLNNSWCEAGLSIIADTNKITILSAACANPGFTGPLNAAFLQLDINGLITLTNFINIYNNNLYIGGDGSLNKTPTGYIFAGSLEDTLNGDAYLVNLNYLGDTVWTRRFGDSAFQSGWMVKPASDGGYLMCGSTATVDTFGNVLIIKTDSSGNLLWQKDYGYFGSNEVAVAITKTADDGYALIGWRSNGAIYDIYLLKIDSLGNFQWDTTYGSQWPDEAWGIISTQDGNIVIAGSYAFSNGGHQQPYLAKFDLAGNMLWERKYAGGFGGGILRSIRELSNGSLISTGDDDFPPFPPSTQGLILKTTANGDSLWYKNYYSSYYGHSYLYDIYPSPDGGFVACGFVSPQAPDTGHQDLWVLKVDSVGCEISNCTVGITEYGENKIKVSVYPNPFTNELNIKFDQADELNELRVINIFGNEIFQCLVPEVHNSINLELIDGLYLIQVIRKDKLVYSEKVCRISH